MKLLVYYLAAVVSPLLAATVATPNGIVKGVVTDEAGHLESGVVVTAKLLPPVPVGNAIPSTFAFFAASGLSGSDGGFQINGLPAGTFSLCAEKQGSQLLNPCVWGSPSSTPVAAGATVTGISVKVQNGVAIVVRLADGQGVLAANPQKDDILIGTAYNKSPFISPKVVKSDATGRTLLLVVPPGLNFNLSVYSSAFSLKDGLANVLPSSAALPITAASLAAGVVQTIDPTTAPPVVTINVAALAAAKP